MNFFLFIIGSLVGQFVLSDLVYFLSDIVRMNDFVLRFVSLLCVHFIYRCVLIGRSNLCCVFIYFFILKYFFDFLFVIGSLVHYC